jgi:peroxiredoxin (alkyl hydroperoxide reductase subunit C)
MVVYMEEGKAYRMPLIGDPAPAFNAVTTQGEINFPEDYYGRWVVLFSHPADFTPVCTTEFMTFASMINEFKALNAELIGLSIDSIYSHIAWLRKIKELAWKDMKHVEVTFPLIADITMEIAKMYGMLHPGASSTQTVRAVFIIDPVGKIRAILYYPLTTGRNVEEIFRILMALQKSDAESIATPANWTPYDDVILPAPGTCGAAKHRMDNLNENTYCLDWFLCFQQNNSHPDDPGNEPEGMPYPSMYPQRGRKNYRRNN